MKVLKVHEDGSADLQLTHREVSTVLEGLALSAHMAKEADRVGFARQISAVDEPMNADELDKMGEELCQALNAKFAEAAEAEVHGVKGGG